MTDKEIRSGEAAIVQKQADDVLRESEATVRKKLEAILEPEGDIGTLNLADIIDHEALQTMMEDFYRLTKIGIGVLDVSGKVLVAVGWQDLCTKFHRVHPDTLKNCLESDVILSNGVPAETFKAYHCKNNLWDMVTPIEVSGRHLGNIFLGQFFYEDEIPDYELFRSQARHYGFDETEYLAALDRVPRWSREAVDAAMAFYAKLAGMISSLSYSTVELSRALSQKELALRQLGESEERYRSILNASPDDITITDLEGRILMVSPAALRVFGCKREEELLGRLVTDFIVPEDRERASSSVALTFQGDMQGPIEYRGLRTDRSTFDMEVNGETIRNAEGQPTQIVSIIRDITECKRVEDKLRVAQLQWSQFLEASPDPMWIKDASGRYVAANKTYYQMEPSANGDIVGKTDAECFPPEIAAVYAADDCVAIEKGVSEGEFTDVDADGKFHNFLTKKVVLRGPDGSVAGTLGVSRDITGRKQAEAQLRQSQKMEAIGQLAGGVAHDFNNLLTGILGNIALMRSSLPPADPLLENLNAAETAARQAADLTKGLLTFGRSAMVLPIPMKITDALEATLAILKQSLPATIDIVRDDEQTAWNVLVDQSQVTQILLNLAVNARDAMQDKGMLTIRTRNEVVGEEYVQTHPFARTGEFVHLSVTDTGPGISSEVMQHLFEPFYTTKPIGSGTGLGLSVVYGAVKQAGGWITAVSTEGAGKTAPLIGQTCSGATFDIYLPRCLEEPTQSVAPASITVNAGSGTVLVVEDEPVVRTVAQALLSRSGYTILTAPDGASALNVLREHPVGIGLILLDMTMPGMTTGEIVHAIRALDPTVPILLNSGYTSNGTVKQMLEEGSVQGFLGKPYDLHQLLDKVQRSLHAS
ncbi:MAG: PocR ligand-binding domain-containing protein [Caldisericia bacterium]